MRKVLDGKDLGGYGVRTKDLGGDVGTVEVGDRVVAVLREVLQGTGGKA